MWTIIGYVTLGWFILCTVFIAVMWLGAIFTKNKEIDMYYVGYGMNDIEHGRGISHEIAKKALKIKDNERTKVNA